MNYPEELFATGPPSTENARGRRLSDPGRPSESLSKALSRRNSDPGNGFSVFALRNDTLRPVTQQSMNSRSDGRRLSYAETSSATQSFVSFDSAPMDSTPTHSAVAFSTASDGEDLGAIPPYRNARHDSPARSNTVYAPQAAGPRLDPRRTATMGPDPRQASNGPARQPAQPSLTSGKPDFVPDVVLDAGDRAARRHEGVPQSLHAGRRREGVPQPLDAGDRRAEGVPQSLRPGDRTARDPEGVPQSLRPGERTARGHQSGAQDERTVRGYQSGAQDAGDRTVHGSEGIPQSQPQRRGTRETSNSSQRRDAREAATQQPPSLPYNPYSSSAQEAYAPASHDSDPRRSYKVSATPTIVPTPAPAPRTDEPSRPSFQDSRQRLPSAASASNPNRAPEQESRQRLPSAAAPESRPRLPSTASNPNRVAPTAPPPPANKPLPAADPRHQEPQTPTTVRPSTASNRPATPSTPNTPKPKPEQPRRAMPTSTAAAISSQRPPLPSSISQMDTKYVNMLLAIDSIPSLYNILASFFTWILLAGFVLFPGTFTNLQQNNELGALGITAANVIKHLSLYVIAWVCTFIGAAGMSWLWYRWRGNYIWCLNRIFLPGLMNSLAGVLSTLASVLGTQNATFSISSKSTIIVTSTIAGICGILTAFYMFVLIRGLKKQHDAEVGKQRAGEAWGGVCGFVQEEGGGVILGREERDSPYLFWKFEGTM
ncbi:hypothetical protein MVEN_02139700 [Mycena venus]|uniref:Uncharacterized protein n=1 Tax=Mycena venus TaxID=2733690 RepID=A0A8H7CGZ2_9AGAR|nr:hypothetical protein MVEN_02139700 [Mycena venus]